MTQFDSIHQFAFLAVVSCQRRVYSRVMNAVAAVLSPLVALGMLAACGMRNADCVQPITEAQRVRVLNAVQGLQQALNHSPCGSILAIADEQLRNTWIEQCEHIREAWGDWRSFGANYWYRSGPRAIAVEGIAGFTKGNCVVQIFWALESPSPRMLAFFLTSKEDRVDFPSLPPRLMDPPPKIERVTPTSTSGGNPSLSYR